MTVRLLVRLREKVCLRCDEEFRGTTGTKFCPDCRRQAALERGREYSRAYSGQEASGTSTPRPSGRQAHRLCWKVVQDPGPEPFAAGAAFNHFDVRETLRMGYFNAGAILEHDRLGRFRVSADRQLIPLPNGDS